MSAIGFSYVGDMATVVKDMAIAPVCGVTHAMGAFDCWTNISTTTKVIGIATWAIAEGYLGLKAYTNRQDTEAKRE